MTEGGWQAQNAFARSVLPPADEIPVQMSPFSNDRWDRDHEENIRRKAIQRSYVYDRRYFEQPNRVPEEPMSANPPQEPEIIGASIQEPENIPQVPINPLVEVSSKDYFKKEPPQVFKPKSLHEIQFQTPGPPNLYPVLKFPEKRLKADSVYHLPSTDSYVPRPSGLPEEPLQMAQPPKPEFVVFKDYQPERSKPMHYGVHVPLWQFSSNQRDLTKKNKLGRSLELKVNKKNSNVGGGSTKSDLSKPVSTQSSHENIAKVLKTLGGISKSLGYKVPKEDASKSCRSKKKKNSKMLTMKKSDSQEFGAKQPKQEENLEFTTSTTDLFQTQSQTSLSQKMAEVLCCVTSKKPLSELNLLKIGKNSSSYKNGNVSVPNFVFEDSTNTFPSNTFSALENKVPIYVASNRLPVGEKSRSSEYFKYMTLTNQPSKSLSFENDQSLRAERRESKPRAHPHSISRNTSESFIRKIDLTKSKDSCLFRNSPSSFMNSFDSVNWRKLGFSEPDSPQQQLNPDTISVDSYSRNSPPNRICRHRSHSGSAKVDVGNPSCFPSLLSPISTNSRFCCCDMKKEKRESLKAESKQSSNPAAGTESRKPSKMNMRVCHCPHLHTENAIKKICFHNCLTPQQIYSSKPFKVNYFSKEEKPKRKESSETHMKQHKELVMDGSKTGLSKVVERKESSVRGVDKALATHLVGGDVKKSPSSFKASDKVISKTSLKSRKSFGSSKTEKKEKLKKTRTFPEYARPNVMLWNKENHVQILGQSSLKKGTSEKKASERPLKHPVELKPVKIAPQIKESVRRIVRPLSRLRSRDSKKLSKDERALEELAVLEKLFAKLNTVERSLRRQKCADSQHQYRSLSKTALQKDKGEEESRLSFNQMKSLLMLDSPAEEECQRRRKKLRSAIIRHVQNWLKLDFDEL